MMNNDLTSSSVDTRRGTKRPRPSPPSSQDGMPDCPASSDAEAEGRSPRRMRMSPTDSSTNSYGGSVAGLNLLVTEIHNTAAPYCSQDVYESPTPPQSQTQSRIPSLSLSPFQHKQQRPHQWLPPLRVHRPGKRTVYVQDMVFRLLVMSQLETINHDL